MRTIRNAAACLWLLLASVVQLPAYASIFDDFQLIMQTTDRINASEAKHIAFGELEAGSYLIEVDQLDIDLTVALISPTELATRVNTLTERVGNEYLSFELTENRLVEAQLAAPDQPGVSGRYELSLFKIPNDHKGATDAFRRLSLAGTLGHDLSEAARYSTIEHLKAALLYFENVGDGELTPFLHYWIAMNYYWPLQIADAERHYLKATAGFELTQSSRLAATARLDLAATIMEDQSLDEAGNLRLSEAAAMFEQNIAILMKLGSEYTAATGINNLGLLEMYRGNFDVADAHFQRAESIFAKSNSRAKVAQVYANRAWVQENKANIRLARSMYREALERVPPDSNAWLRSVILTNLAATERRLGNANKALALLGEVKAFQEQAGDPAELAWTLKGIAAIYRGLNDPRNAIVFQSRSVDIRRTRLESGGLFDALLQLGYDHLSLARRSNDPLQTQLGLDAHIEARSLAANNTQKAEISLALGRDYIQLGHHEKAQDELLSSLEHSLRAENQYLANLARLEFVNLDGADRAEAIEAVATAKTFFEDKEPSVDKATALYSLARLTENRSEALRLGEKALGVLAELRRNIANPWLAVRMTETEYPIAEHQIELLLAGGATPDASRAALEIARAHRATALLSLLAEVKAAFQDAVPSRLAEDLTRAYEEYQQALTRKNAAHEANTLDAATNHDGELRQRLVDIDIARARIREEMPQYAESVFGDRPSLASVSAWLASNDIPSSTVLFYFVGQNRSYGWKITRDEISSWTMPGEQELSELTSGVVEQITKRSAITTFDFYRNLRRTARKLLPPDINFEDSERLIIVPDGPIGFVPFSALVVEDGGRPRYLIELTELQLVNSLSHLNPDHDTRRGYDPQSLALVTNTTNNSSLPGAQREVQDIAERWGDGNSLIRLGGSGGVSDLQTALATKSIIHFASHARVDTDTPALSGLSIAAADGIQIDFTLAHVLQLRLDADLVILSACETALGEQVRGESALGLVRGFRYAGARQVLATNWRVADRFSYEFSNILYEELTAAARPYSAALRAAQLRVLKDYPSARHPYYWASYSITGHN